MTSTGQILEDIKASDAAIATITATPVVAPFTVPEVVAVITTSEAYPTLQADVVATLALVRALPSYADLERERVAALADAKAVKVTDAASYTRADELATKLAEVEDRINDWWEPLTSFGFRFHRWLTARRGEGSTDAKTERARLLSEAGAWSKEQARLQAIRDAEAAAAQKKADDDVALAQAGAYEAQGMPEEAAAILEAAAAAPAPIVATPSFVPKGGLSHGTDWKIDVINADLVPRNYCSPDTDVILKVVRAMKGKIHIPGVKITEIDTTKGRRRAS